MNLTLQAKLIVTETMRRFRFELVIYRDALHDLLNWDGELLACVASFTILSKSTEMNAIFVRPVWFTILFLKHCF